jgi:hypothetical protein
MVEIRPWILSGTDIGGIAVLPLKVSGHEKPALCDRAPRLAGQVRQGGAAARDLRAAGVLSRSRATLGPMGRIGTPIKASHCRPMYQPTGCRGCRRRRLVKPGR